MANKTIKPSNKSIQYKKEKERLSTKLAKAQMIDALAKTLGIVTSAAKICDIPRERHYDWLRTDPEYVEAVESIAELATDFVESKLHGRISKDDTTAIIFYLKTKAKKRGYIESSHIDHTTKGDKVEQVFKIGDIEISF